MPPSARKTPLRIANAGGYWGDDPTALLRQLKLAACDYIHLDFLAELTMAILQKQRARDPESGYARDFVGMVVQALPLLKEKNVRIVSNAGGGNPIACAAAIAREAAAKGLRPRIAVVTGDDVLPRLVEWHGQGIAFTHLDTGAPFDKIREKVTSAHAYLGAWTIAKALETSPDIVVTGRVTDAALTLGPCLHEFGWRADDWDLLAAATVAGHLLECGAQATGGNFTDWHLVPDLAHIGYPIAEINADGHFFITKAPGTGGLVSPETVSEQLLYEIGDPAAYLTPDVSVDFTQVVLTQAGPDRVEVRGARGQAPPVDYKVAMTFAAGFKCVGSVIVSGPAVEEKARLCADIFWQRCGSEFQQTATEFVGWNACHRGLGDGKPPEEIVVRFAARSPRKESLALLAKEIPALVLSGPAGITFEGPAPSPMEILGYWPTLVPRRLVEAALVVFDGTEVSQPTPLEVPAVPEKETLACTAGEVADVAGGPVKRSRGGVELRRLCLVRSGDKGNKVNLGVIARGPKAFAFLKKRLTAQQIKDWFAEFCLGKVTRYELPGVRALNFVLDEALDGGGMASLRMDALGKMMGQALARQCVEAPPDVVAEGARK